MLRTSTLIFVSSLAFVLIIGRSSGQTVTFYGTDAVAPSFSVFDLVEYPIYHMTHVGGSHYSSNTLDVIIVSDMVPGTKVDIFQGYSFHVSGMALTHYAAGLPSGSIGEVVGYPDNPMYLPDMGVYSSFASDPHAVFRTTVADVDAGFGAELWGYASPIPEHPSTFVGTVQGTGVTVYAYSFLPTTSYDGA